MVFFCRPALLFNLGEIQNGTGSRAEQILSFMKRYEYNLESLKMDNKNVYERAGLPNLNPVWAQKSKGAILWEISSRSSSEMVFVMMDVLHQNYIEGKWCAMYIQHGQ